MSVEKASKHKAEPPENSFFQKGFVTKVRQEQLEEGGLEMRLLPVVDHLMGLMGTLAEPLPSLCSLAFTPFTGHPLAPKTFSELANFHESKWGHFPPFFLISTRLVP